MERKDGSRRHFIYGAKDVKLGWIFDSKTNLFPPKEERNYSSTENRQYDFFFFTKDQIMTKIFEHNKDQQWYKDVCCSTARDIFYVHATVDIELRASEVVSYEPGQEIVTSVLSNKDIHILIFLNKALNNAVKLMVELRRYFNCVLEEKEDAFLPVVLKSEVISTNIYHGNHNIEIKNIIHTLNEGCRILKITPFDKAKIGYTINGKLQHQMLHKQCSLKDSQKINTNTAEAISESCNRNKDDTKNQLSENSSSAIPSAVNCSQMTKTETNKITETIMNENKITNVGSRENYFVTTTECLITHNKKIVSPEGTKIIMNLGNQGETPSCEAKIQNREIINIQTTERCENQSTTVADSYTMKREIKSSQGRIPHQPSKIEEPCRRNIRGRSNSRKRLPEQTSVGSCDNQSIRQENYETNEMNETQKVPSKIINHKQNHGEISHSVNDKDNLNVNKDIIINSQYAKECNKQTSTFTDNTTPKRERSISRGRKPNQLIDTNKCGSTRGRSSSRKRIVVDNVSIGSHENQNIKHEKCPLIEKDTNQNVNKELGRNIRNEMQTKNVDHTSIGTNYVSHQNVGIDTNKCGSTRGRSSSIKRIVVDNVSIGSHENQNIKHEKCTVIEKDTNQNVNKELERNIRNEMQSKNVDHTSIGTNYVSHQNVGKTISISKNSDVIPKIHSSIIPRDVNQSGKLFGNNNTNSISNLGNSQHTFGLQSDIDKKVIKTIVNDLDSEIKGNTNVSSKETTMFTETSLSSNESKSIHSMIDKSADAHDSNSNCTRANAVSCHLSQSSSKHFDHYSSVSSSNSSSLVQNAKHSYTRDLGKKHVEENNSSTHKSTAINENSSKDNSMQCKSVFDSSSQNSSTKTSNFFKILEPKRKITDNCGIEKQFYGEHLQDSEEKVILLLGASGSGKTTLVNFVANYFEGVKTPDEKMVLVNPILTNTKQSHTQEIKAYSFCSEREPGLNVTFIDTPGLNDSSGAEVRDHVQSLKTFLANMNANGLKIHALGFVAQAHLVRLTSSERLVMDYVSTLFGEKVKDNIITFVTFADNQENPPVVEAVQNYGLKTKHFLKFNNSILSANTYEVEDLDRVYWRKGFKSLKKGVKIIKDMSPLCVNAMKALQKEVYSKTVVDGAMKDLEAEVLNFVYIIEKGNDKENTKQAGSQVWELATAAYYQIKQSNNSYASVEDLVKKVTVELCQKKSIHPYECLKYLTFAPSRGMRPAALSIIYSLNIVYNSLKNNNTKAKNPSKKAKKSHGANNVMLFCHVCDKEHFMERLSKSGWFGKDNSNTKEVILKCKVCECAGDVHGVKVETNANQDLSINGILQHVRNGLCNVIQRYSIPDVTITDNDLLQCLMEEVADQYKPFINDLLHMRNIV